MRFILDSIQYDDHKWPICADLKVVAILTGLQSGYTKYCCFLCLWDSRDRKEHYSRKEWQCVICISQDPGISNIKNPALIGKSDVLLPPLHIKLGLMKQMVKAMDKTLPAFDYLVEKLPHLSGAKIKEGIFVGPQIRQLIFDSSFDASMNDIELAAWVAFKNVCARFLGKHKDMNYVQ